MRVLSLFLALNLACAHKIVIDSRPQGAKVYVNGAPSGQTPAQVNMTTGLGGSSTVEIQKEGYKTQIQTIRQNKIYPPMLILSIGGLVFLPCLLGLAGVTQYDEYYTFQLEQEAPKTSQTVN